MGSEPLFNSLGDCSRCGYPPERLMQTPEAWATSWREASESDPADLEHAEQEADAFAWWKSQQ